MMAKKDYYKALFEKKTEEVFADAMVEIEGLKSQITTPADARRVQVFEALLEKARTLEKERSLLKSIVGGVQKAILNYRDNPEGQTTNNRARTFLRNLGVITGKRQKKIDGEKLLFEYMELLRGTSKAEAILFDSEERPPQDKWQAIKILKKKHGISTTESCHQHLKIAKAEYNKSHQDQIGNILPYLSDTAPNPDK